MVMQPAEDNSRNTGIDFGKNNTFGSLTISGKVAGRDLIELHTSPAMAEGVETRQQFIDLIAKLREDVARLTDIPDGEQEDADDDLRKAAEATEKGDADRVVQKLESVQAILTGLSAAIPAAIKLGETIGVLIQRVPVLA